jgi:hypothetical protein
MIGPGSFLLFSSGTDLFSSSGLYPHFFVLSYYLFLRALLVHEVISRLTLDNALRRQHGHSRYRERVV